MGLLDGDSEETTTITFAQSSDGGLTLTGDLMYNSHPIPFTARKTGPGAERHGQAVTVTRAWLKFEPRAISLVEYLEFQEPE